MEGVALSIPIINKNHWIWHYLMMRNIIIYLFLFVIVGCTSLSPYEQIIQSSHPEVISTNKISENEIEEFKWQTVVVKNYDNLNVSIQHNKAEAMSITTGEKFHVGNYSIGTFTANKYKMLDTVIENCERLFNSECVITKSDIGSMSDITGQEEGGKNRIVRIYYRDLDDYIQKTNKRIQDTNRKMYAYSSQEDYLEQQKRISIALKEKSEKAKKDEEEKRVAVLVALKERCIEYGFTGNNNIASCIQREAQHDFEIEQQKYQVALLKQELADQRMYASQNTQQVQVNESAEIPFWMEILGAFAEGAAEGYKQKQLIEALDSRYQGKTRYIYKAEVECGIYGC
tara:strand:+ start:207 stop:1235 length:1029 start_codon:yes stop_codon:yes gene_type:complete